MKLTRQEELIIAERAALWMARLRHMDHPNDRAEFISWLKQSPIHVREMLCACALDLELGKFDPERKVDLDALAQRAGVNVVPLESIVNRDTAIIAEGLAKSSKARNTRMGWRWLAGLSAAACLSVALVLGWSHVGERSASQQQFATAIGEQRSVDLSDGSTIHLNTQSNVRIAYSDRARDVYLAEGQAIFKVQHDAARPFRVHVNSTVVQAIGTQFDVRRLKDRTTVAVIEGAVQVISAAPDRLDPEARSKLPESTKIGAGETVVIDADGKLARDTIDVQQTVAWQEGRLIFHQNTLAEIAAEFNRYNKVQIRVEGNFLQVRRYSGVFDANEPEMFLQYLAVDTRFAFDRSSENVVVLRLRSSYALTPSDQ